MLLVNACCDNDISISSKTDYSHVSSKHREGGNISVQTYVSISRLNLENEVEMDKANRYWHEEEGERYNRLEIFKPRRKKNN